MDKIKNMYNELEEIPNILPTGISKEYFKAFGRLNLFLRSIYEGKTTFRIKKFAENNLSNYRFKKYDEWFKPTRFRNVITDKNKRAINDLNKIVDELNSLVTNKKIIEKPNDLVPHKPTEYFNKAMSIILGVRDFNFKKICETGEVTKYFSL